MISFGILTALFKSEDWMIQRYGRGRDEVAKFLRFEVTGFLTVLFVSWLMARIEGRKFSDCGLPRRRMFRSQFWLGAVTGFATVTFLLTLLRLSRAFYFGTLAEFLLDSAPAICEYEFIFIL